MTVVVMEIPINSTYFKCLFVTLISQHAKRLCRNVPSSVTQMAVLQFSHKLPGFSKKKITECNMYFVFNYDFFRYILFLRKI